tara:strand:- start:211 stop:870 length:660 start_codon:yes stop_codon:yes gene_type:complete
MKTKRITVIKKGQTKRRKKSKRKGIKRKSKRKTKNSVYNKNDYKSGDGMLTSVWGPSLWHYLHTMSFNYPVYPSPKEKKKYKNFIMSLKDVLPCKYCRINMKKNLKAVPLNNKALKNRTNFSKWMYCLHEHINKMLKKKSGLKYCQIRERYEHFRSRCTLDLKDLQFENETKKTKKRKKEKGCTESLYGKKSKCLIRIVPKENREVTLKIDKKCIKKKI